MTHRTDGGRFGRRQFLGLGAGIGVGLAMGGRAFADPLAHGVTAVVPTSNGPVLGLSVEGIQTFLGLRYGAPPLGDLRFAPPRKPEPWKAVAAAINLGPSSMQYLAGGGAAGFPGTIGMALGQGMNSFEDVIRQHEDCLFINLWTPELGGQKHRPVMVWLHGGGFSYGSGSWPFYDGHNLARNHDVVVVTVNHRLSVFGFSDVADIGGDPASGNAGMLDIVQVLEWVRDNAEAFGGDPGNVTVFGQSGGGGKVSTLQAMPGAHGLFHRGIIESGPSLRAGSKEMAAADTKALMAKLGVSDLKGLQAVPAEALAAAGGGRGRPILDGVAIPAHPFDPVANPLSANVPIMIGCTSDEQTLYNVGKDWWGKLTDDGLVAQLTPQFGDKTAALIAGAKALRPDDSPSYLYTDITSKAGAFMGSVALAERKSAQPGGVWMYVWEWGAPVDGGMLRAPHTMEIPFAFDNVDKGPMLLGTDPATFALGRQTSNVWTQFARSGDPNISGLPHWPKYDPATRATMMFNTESRVENDPYGAMRQILATIPRRGPMG
jgi:para-nitrobenzyl esterase